MSNSQGITQRQVEQRGTNLVQPQPNQQQALNQTVNQRFKSETIKKIINITGRQPYFHSSRQQEILKKGIKNHQFNQPKWDNSFSLETSFFTILTIMMILLYFICFIYTNLMDIYWKIGLGFLVFFLYILDCRANGCGKYMKNVITITQFKKYIEELKQIELKLQYKITTSHNEERVYQSNGETKKETKRVITQQNVYNIPITKILDETENTNDQINKFKIFRAHTFINYSYGDNATEKYLNDMKKHAELKAVQADDTYEGIETIQCPSLKQNLIVVAENYKVDAMFNRFVYFTYCLVGLGLLYRIFLNRRVGFVEICIHKKISVDHLRGYDEFKDQKLSMQATQGS